MPRFRFFLPFVFFLTLAGCSGDDDAPMDASTFDTGPDTGSGEDASIEPMAGLRGRRTNPEQSPLPGETECVVAIAGEPAPSAGHLELCTPNTYPLIPPTGGDHYARWASFGSYTEPVPWSFLVHSMEHGGIVLAHRCSESECPEVHALFDTLMAEREDELCREGVRNRFVKVPAPDLGAPFAVVAWEFVYQATCVDEESIREFIDEHYAGGPEDLCAQGVDLSDEGWCP